MDEKVKFIDDHRDQHKLSLLLKVAKLSKSSYFEFKNKKISNQEKRKLETSKSIKKIWLDSNKIYGARKIKAELELEGISTSERTVGNYMKDMKIASVYRRNTDLIQVLKLKTMIYLTIQKTFKLTDHAIQ